MKVLKLLQNRTGFITKVGQVEYRVGQELKSGQ